MSKTCLNPDFLVACLRVMEYKRKPMIGCMAGLLHLALEGGDFTACDLPGELTGGSLHLAGCASGALVAQGLIISVGRVPSPHENAKGRKTNIYRLGNGQRSRAIAFLKAQNLPAPEAGQQLTFA